MANIFCSFGRYGRNVAKSSGIANHVNSFTFLRKFELTDCCVTRCFTVLPSVDSADDNVKTSNYSSLIEGNSEIRTTLISRKLAELFKIEYNVASRLVNSNPSLVKAGSANISKTAETAERVGILKKILLRYPSILSIPSGDLKYAVKLLTNYYGKINETAPLLILPMHKLIYITSFAIADRKIIPQKNRIAYFSEKLEFDALTICDALTKHNYLFILPFSRIDTIMTLLLNANVQKDDILNDLWIFRHCLNTIEKRIEITKQAEIKRVKPWMLRCPDETLSVTISRHLKTKLLLGGHTSISGYLSERLKCSEEDIDIILKRNPVLQRTNVLKLKTIIDYLYTEGYEANQILAVPRVLAHSFNTLRSRHEELRVLGYNTKSLGKLCMSQQKFNAFLSKLSD